MSQASSFGEVLSCKSVTKRSFQLKVSRPTWEKGDVVTARTVIGPYINIAGPLTRATAVT